MTLRTGIYVPVTHFRSGQIERLRSHLRFGGSQARRVREVTFDPADQKLAKSLSIRHIERLRSHFRSGGSKPAESAGSLSIRRIKSPRSQGDDLLRQQPIDAVVAQDTDVIEFLAGTPRSDHAVGSLDSQTIARRHIDGCRASGTKAPSRSCVARGGQTMVVLLFRVRGTVPACCGLHVHHVTHGGTQLLARCLLPQQLFCSAASPASCGSLRRARWSTRHGSPSAPGAPHDFVPVSGVVRTRCEVWRRAIAAGSSKRRLDTRRLPFNAPARIGFWQAANRNVILVPAVSGSLAWRVSVRRAICHRNVAGALERRCDASGIVGIHERV